MLDPQLSRSRQQRLLERMHTAGLDRVIVRQSENVQWLTAFRPHRLMAAAVSLDADGHCILAAPNEPPENVAADEVVTFEAQWCCTLRQEQPIAVHEALSRALTARPQAASVGMEFSLHFQNGNGPQIQDIEPTLWQLRRRKDPDELTLIQRAIECTDAMYTTSREIIRPGITELEVFSQLHAAAVDVAGEPLTHPLGNDFQCNSPGGAPRERPANAGELFILDLGPAYRGYYADNCRAVSVNGSPTDEQHQAWEVIVAVLAMVEDNVRPGVRCRDLYERAKAMLDDVRCGAFFHHLGHGIGLFPHEAPHLNPRWDDQFEEGDVFTAEPGLYWEELRAGIRLEENYRVTTDGVERLTTHPLAL